jgi:hypothetical protein
LSKLKLSVVFGCFSVVSSKTKLSLAQLDFAWVSLLFKQNEALLSIA